MNLKYFYFYKTKREHHKLIYQPHIPLKCVIMYHLITSYCNINYLKFRAVLPPPSPSAPPPFEHVRTCLEPAAIWGAALPGASAVPLPRRRWHWRSASLLGFSFQFVYKLCAVRMYLSLLGRLCASLRATNFESVR